MLYFSEGSRHAIIDQRETARLLDSMLMQLGTLNRVLLIPPDGTRFHSGAGDITCMLWKRLSPHCDVAVLPALGTHRPMSPDELDRMFPGIPHACFRVHDWRNQVGTLGVIEADFVESACEGVFRADVRVELSNHILNEPWDAIVSMGQLVPHEVVGIANHNKNILVGCGGSDFINKSHFIGAAFGMERMMGRAETPVRRIFDEASRRYLANLPIRYVLTVREAVGEHVLTRGLFAGDDNACFEIGSKLCQQVNLNFLDREITKAIVWLDPREFKSTWLGNKAIYRTRMALADGGELIVLGPGVKEFGEDPAIDRLIRKYGYHGTPATLDAVTKNVDLASNLSAAAHLIHGSSEGRFTITYCPGHLSQAEIESVGFRFGDVNDLTRRYRTQDLRDGWNHIAGEEIFYISNPGLGLWGVSSRWGSSVAVADSGGIDT